MSKLKIFISGQKYFGQEVFRLCNSLDFVEIVGVCAPLDDKYITRLAHTFNVPVIAAGTLRAETFPAGIDLGITAHSFDYIGRKTRYKAKHGWIGYHPSLLPRHRGRSSIEWAVRFRDPITGGTIFWLNDGIDRGDIAYQDFCFIDPALYAKEPKKAAKLIWENDLQPMGLRLLEKALRDIHTGKLIRRPQDKRFSTFEPNSEAKDVFKPDALLLDRYAGESR